MPQAKSTNTQKQETSGEETVKHQTRSENGRKDKKEERAQEIAGVGKMATAGTEQIAHSPTTDRKEKDNRGREDPRENAMSGKMATADTEQAANTHTVE